MMHRIKKQHALLDAILDRRKLLTNSAKGSAGLIMASALLQSACSGNAPTLTVNGLNASLWLISGAGCNVLVKKAGDGELLVIDGGLEQNAAALQTTIAQVAGSENISTLSNTHWHREQTGLNRILGEAGVRIFSHENTRQWLSVDIQRPWEELGFEALALAAQPTESFYHYGDFQHADTLVQYGHLLQAHTDGDMYVYFPEDNVLHAGGVVSNDGYPIIDWWTGGWIGGLVDGLETLLGIANQDTVIVPANGPVMSRAELVVMRDMYDTIFQRIRTLFMSAYGPQDTLNAAPTAEFDAQWGDPDLFVLLAHQSVLPHYSPDA